MTTKVLIGWSGPESHEVALIGLNDGLGFVDLGDPLNPVYLGKLPTRTSTSLWRDVRVHADHALVVSEAPAHGMQVFDLSQLAAVVSPPVTFAASAHYAGFGDAHNISVNEDTGYAYAVGSNGCSTGLHILDVSAPLTPVFAGCFAGDGYTHDVQCWVYQGPDVAHQGSEICFAANEDTLTIVDVTDKANPVQLSSTGYAGFGYVHQGWLADDHRYLLVDDELDEVQQAGHTRTFVYDVSDLDPVVVGFHEGPTSAIDHNQFVVGDHVFQANYRAGIRILRQGNLAAAELGEVAFFDTFTRTMRRLSTVHGACIPSSKAAS